MHLRRDIEAVVAVAHGPLLITVLPVDPGGAEGIHQGNKIQPLAAEDTAVLLFRPDGEKLIAGADDLPL